MQKKVALPSDERSSRKKKTPIKLIYRNLIHRLLTYEKTLTIHVRYHNRYPRLFVIRYVN